MAAGAGVIDRTVVGMGIIRQSNQHHHRLGASLKRELDLVFIHIDYVIIWNENHVVNVIIESYVKYC